MFAQSALVDEIGKLQKFAFRLTRNKSDADDLVQSTCLRALEKAHYFKDGTNLFGWTSKIMFNLFVSSYRRKSKFETKFDPESYLEKASVAAGQDSCVELENVRKAMTKLSAEHQEILVLVCIKGMRYEEVSGMLQIPVGTVRSRLARARKQLQTIMDTPTTQRSANTNMPVIPAYIISGLQRRRA